MSRHFIFSHSRICNFCEAYLDIFNHLSYHILCSRF
nr:MAG TPA: hypothetical protein [Caudoviricetes sp.]